MQKPAKLSSFLMSSSAAFGFLLIGHSPALANPVGGQVAVGSVSISRTSGTTTVDQTSEGAVINWSSFNVAPGQTTTFQQPNAQAIAINRIGGKNASQILGTIDANGRIVLINNNGILFGKSSQVDVGSLVATTSGGTDSNLLNGKFTRTGNISAAVINEGTINAAQGGLVALVAPHVANSGVVNAQLGTVALGGTNKFTVDFAGDGLVSFAVKGKTAGQVANAGSLSGATVMLSASSAEGVASGVVDAGGTITAQAARNVGGKIELDAGQGGSIDISGNLNASGARGGGTIDATAKSGTLNVDKGALLSADATEAGSGGKIHLVAQDTQFAGAVFAKGIGKGGNAEISGTNTLSFSAIADLTAASGKVGTLTLDPKDYFINSSGVSPEPGASVISVSALENELADANVALTTIRGGSQSGDITIAASFSWSSPHKLMLNAYRNIVFDNGVTVSSTGGGDLNLVADRYATGSGSVTFEGSSALDVSGGGSVYIYYDPTSYDAPVNYGSAVSVTGSGQNIAFMWVNTLAELQAIGTDSTTLAGDYALSQNIDASATATWNSGLGFIPIGTDNTYGGTYAPFTGTFDGSGHTISNLTIDNDHGTYVGLFGYSTGLIEYTNLSGGSVTGQDIVGALAGESDGKLLDDSSSATISGGLNVGGLVGATGAGSRISGSNATGNVSAEVDYGGLVGENAANISNSFAMGTVSGPENVAGYGGGFVGINWEATISDSYATGDVSGNNAIGGFAGYDNGTITQSFATGTATGADMVGGFVGNVLTNHTVGTIRDCYSLGDVFGTSSSAVGIGGFVGAGFSGKIVYSYEAGAVTYGVAFGTLEGTSTTAIYYDTTNNNGLSAGSSGSVGLTTVQLQSGLPAGFSGAIWGSNPDINSGMPYLLSTVPPA